MEGSASVATPTPAPPAEAAAPAAQAGRVSGRVVVASVLAVALGYVVALVLNSELTVPDLEVTSDFKIVALFYVVAQALERLLEPFASWVGADEKAEAVKDAKDAHAQQEVALEVVSSNATPDEVRSIVDGGPATAATGLLASAARKADDADARLARVRANRAVGLWAAATVLGMLVSGALGIHFVQTVAPLATGTPVPTWLDEVDILITGLVIGGGTKPLHDLITRIEKAKETAQEKS